MKTTDNFISTISGEARQKRNETATKYYRVNIETQKIKSKLNYYKKKWGEDCVNDYIKEYGITDECINIIKQNTYKPLPILRKTENI